MEIYIGPGAHLNFVELQSWGENVINFTRENVEVDRDGSVDWIFGALGSRLTKNYSNLNLLGQGSMGKMSGFTSRIINNTLITIHNKTTWLLILRATCFLKEHYWIKADLCGKE